MGMMACTSTTEKATQSETQNPSQNNMNSFLSIFEIPATDIDRAINFYQAVMDISIEPMAFDGIEMGLFPFENQMVTGVIMKGEGMEPSPSGVTVYLNAGDDLQPMLDRVAANGGQVLVPKTPHADEVGFFAIFLDSEGNKLGLHSPN